MVSIRLSRGGAKKRPFYHIIVTDSRNRRDGRYIERLGYFNPIAVGGERKLKVDLDRVQYWISNGAQPSDRVVKLVKQARAGDVDGTALSAREVRASKVAAAPTVAEESAPVAQEAAPAAQEAAPAAQEAAPETTSDEAPLEATVEGEESLSEAAPDTAAEPVDDAPAEAAAAESASESDVTPEGAGEAASGTDDKES